MPGATREEIIKHLAEVHKTFCGSIKDPRVAKLVRKNSIITGGAIASLLLGEKVRDYDYFFKDKETVLAVAQYYVDEFATYHPTELALTVQDDGDRVRILTAGPGKGPSADTPKPAVFVPLCISCNAITLRNKIQLVTRFYGTPKEIHKSFDFTHCTNYWDSSTFNLHLNAKALESLLSKKLHYTGTEYVLNSAYRVHKFLDRGWRIDASESLKICQQLMSLREQDIAEQAEGVSSQACSELNIGQAKLWAITPTGRIKLGLPVDPSLTLFYSQNQSYVRRWPPEARALLKLGSPLFGTGRLLPRTWSCFRTGDWSWSVIDRA